MKIRDRLLLTFIIFIFLFGITGYLEHRHISKVTDSFQQLDDQIAPSLTSLLELITSIRRVSIKAMEFSIRGKPDDREKTEESITQINQQLRTFLSLHQQDHEQLELDELVDRKNHFIQVLNEYLQMTKGPAIEQVLGKQEELRKAHDELIAHINEALAQASGPVKNKLLLIRSAAQQATVKLMAFILLGNTEDLVKAQQAMDELESARNHLISGSANRPEMVKVVANQTQNYNMLARNYVRDMTSNRHALEDIFRKEEELHAARKALIHTLYPIIERHYAALAQATNNTEKQLVQAGRLKIYSILSVSIIALAAALLLSYTISHH
jgi:CHASE3 domain sensor protein